MTVCARARLHRLVSSRWNPTLQHTGRYKKPEGFFQSPLLVETKTFQELHEYYVEHYGEGAGFDVAHLPATSPATSPATIPAPARVSASVVDFNAVEEHEQKQEGIDDIEGDRDDSATCKNDDLDVDVDADDDKILQFEVEAIVGERVTSQNKREYLVSWVGYSAEENTWEPTENLSAATVKVYELQQEKKTRTTTKKRTTMKKRTANSKMTKSTKLKLRESSAQRQGRDQGGVRSKRASRFRISPRRAAGGLPKPSSTLIHHIGGRRFTPERTLEYRAFWNDAEGKEQNAWMLVTDLRRYQAVHRASLRTSTRTLANSRRGGGYHESDGGGAATAVATTSVDAMVYVFDRSIVGDADESSDSAAAAVASGVAADKDDNGSTTVSSSRNHRSSKAVSRTSDDGGSTSTSTSTPRKREAKTRRGYKSTATGWDAYDAQKRSKMKKARKDKAAKGVM